MNARTHATARPQGRVPGSAPGTTRRLRRRGTAVLAVALTTALVAACSGGTDTPGEGATGGEETTSGTETVEERTLTVLAAASLRDVFTEIATDFEAENEGVTIALSFAGSSDLGDQILAGSPSDVFASADERNMDRVVEAGDAADPVTFATNTLTIVVPPGNPGGVTSFADLADSDLKVVVCAPQVPCGEATDQVSEDAGVEINRVSEEASVTDVLAKVTAGEADAGLVYVTDATLAGDDVEVIDVPETKTVVNVYPIAVTNGSEHPDDAAAFVAYVTGPGQAALAAAGFGAP